MSALSPRPELRVYRFEGAEVYPERFAVARDGREVVLRAKTFQVLVHLIENRDRVVTKDELFATLWPGVVVTEGALAQCVVEIRRALGDDIRTPRYIRTVPKVGYRFLAPLSVEGSPGMPGSASGARLPPGRQAVEQVTAFEVEVQIEDEDAELPAAPPASRRRGRAIAAVSVVALLAAGATCLALRKPAPEVTIPPVPGRTPVLVMPFENASADAGLAWLQEGLADMVIADLSGAEALSVLSRQQLQVLLRRAGLSRERPVPLAAVLELARTTRAEAVVLGSYARLGESLRITLQLHDARTGRLLAAESASAERPERIFGQVDALAGALIARLVPGEQARVPRLASVMTGNLEAYRLYSLANERLEAVRANEAIELLESAVSLDPDFAMAHARLGYAHAVLRVAGDRALPYLERALRLSHRLGSRDRLHILAWQALARSDFDGAISAYERLLRSDPLEMESYLRLGALLEGDLRYEEALDVTRRGLDVDPRSAPLYNLLAGIHIGLSRRDEAVAAARRCVELTHGEPNAYDTLGMAYQWFGLYEDAVASYRAALQRKPDFSVAGVHLGNVLFSMGRYGEALEEFRRWLEVADSDYARMRVLDDIAIVHRRRGETAEAERAARAAAALGPYKYYALLLLAIDRRDPALLDEHLALSWGEEVPDPGRRPSLRPRLFFVGQRLLLAGDAAAGLEKLKEALRQRAPGWHIDALEDALANACLALSRFDEAAREYERILLINPRYPLARYRLGKAYEGMGDVARAREAYRRFLEDTKDADDLTERRDARRRAG